MELVFLRQLVMAIDKMDDTDIEITSMRLPEVGKDEEVLGTIEQDDIKKLFIFYEQLRKEIVEKVNHDTLLFLEDVTTALEELANPDSMDLEEDQRRVRAQVVRINQHELRILRYKIVEKSLNYAMMMAFPDTKDINAIYFRKGWAITKKLSKEVSGGRET